MSGDGRGMGQGKKEEGVVRRKGTHPHEKQQLGSKNNMRMKIIKLVGFHA